MAEDTMAVRRCAFKRYSNIRQSMNERTSDCLPKEGTCKVSVSLFSFA